jgi:hypothetical protein
VWSYTSTSPIRHNAVDRDSFTFGVIIISLGLHILEDTQCPVKIFLVAGIRQYIKRVSE